MEQITFIKNDVIDYLASSINSIEDVKALINSESLSQGALQTFLNRKDQLKDILQGLNSANQKLIMISGFQGTGKTELLKAVLSTLEDNILNYYYECSINTNLDDIILSLYQYLHKILTADPEYLRIQKRMTVKSIDKRLTRYLKSLKRPLLITIDGFENLINDDLEITDNELLRFVNYLLSLTSIKVIISGRRLSSAQFNIPKDNLTNVKLIGLEEESVLNLLKLNNIEGGEQLLYQAFETTRGYPESILLFAGGVNILKFTPFDLLKDYSIRKESFEDYISRKVYSSLQLYYKKILWFFSIIRHPVKYSTLQKLHLSQNLKEILDFLVNNHILTNNSGFYYLKDLFRELVYNSVPVSEKLKIHVFLCDFYIKQVSYKLAEREVQLSRKTLQLELNHHQTSINKYNKDHGTDQVKEYTTELPYASSYIASKYDLKNLSIDLQEVVAVEENIEKIPETKNKDTIKEDLSDQKVRIEGTKDETEYVFKLTEEEKKLLQEENTKENEQETPPSPQEIVPPEEKHEYEKPAHEKPDNLVTEYTSRAVMSKKRGNAGLALSYYQKALDITITQNDNINIAKISRSIANILDTLHKYNEALEYLNKSLDIFTKLNDITNIAVILLKIANIYYGNFKYDIALQYYNKIIILNPDNKYIIDALTGVGDIYDYWAKLDTALKYYLQALEKSVKIEDTESTAKLYFRIAIIYDDLDDLENAKSYYQSNIKITDTKINPYLSASYANLASLYEDIEDTNNAIINYTKALETDRITGNYEGQYKTLSRLGSIYSDIQVFDKALAYFHEELEAAKLTNDPYSVAMSYIDIGDFYFSQKQYENALKSFVKARKSVGNTVSTDSKEKIDRRFRQILSEIGERKFNILVENIKRKYGQ
jgi:tetratricopeptide (TPR) repeat protein